MSKKEKPLGSTSKKKKKRPYKKPKIMSEEIITFGALCNGTNTGGRKTTAGAPDFCSASRLLS